jgi:hypothetical protein
MARQLLVAELTAHTLDEIFQPEAGAPGFERVQLSLKRQMDEVFAVQGVKILGVGIGALKVADEVAEQRIRTWQSGWESKLAVQAAENESKASRRLALARARAQIDLIQQIVGTIEQLKTSPNADLSEIVTLRVVEALEEAQSKELVKALLPQHSLMEARQIQRWLQSGSEET